MITRLGASIGVVRDLTAVLVLLGVACSAGDAPLPQPPSRAEATKIIAGGAPNHESRRGRATREAADRRCRPVGVDSRSGSAESCAALHSRRGRGGVGFGVVGGWGWVWGIFFCRSGGAAGGRGETISPPVLPRSPQPSRPSE